MADRIIVELVVATHLSGAALSSQISADLPGFRLDEAFAPVEIKPRDEDLARIPEGYKVVLVRGEVDPQNIEELRKAPAVLKLWSDGRIEPFGDPRPR